MKVQFPFMKYTEDDSFPSVLLAIQETLYKPFVKI